MKINKLLIEALVVLIISIVFLYIKVGSKTSNQQAATYINSNSVVTTPVYKPASIGKQAPDFTLTDLDGKQYSLKDMQGKVVILFGMAGWCGECIIEGQALTKIQQDYAGKVQVVGVAFTPGDTKSSLQQYEQIGKINIPLAFDTDAVNQKYHLINLDTTYIINQQGIISYKSEQAMNYDQIKQQIDKLL